MLVAVVVNEEKLLLVSLGTTDSTTINVTTLNTGETYRFWVASEDAARRMSNLSQPVSLAMQGLLLFCDHKIVSMQFFVFFLDMQCQHQWKLSQLQFMNYHK